MSEPSGEAGASWAGARAALAAAELAEAPAERYLAAHLAALRVAAVVLSARTRATSPRPRNAWSLVAQVAPEFAEWAGYFAASQAKRQAVAAGATALVTSREADDLLRDAAAFTDLVARRLARPARAREAG